jgi:hypothetical protein
MSDKKPFFMRDPWIYDPQTKTSGRGDARQGFETRALHAGYHPLQDLEMFRSFVPPITPSMTYPYTSFDTIPCPVYGRTRTPTSSLVDKKTIRKNIEGIIASISGGRGHRRPPGGKNLSGTQGFSKPCLYFSRYACRGRTGGEQPPRISGPTPRAVDHR